MKRLLLVDDELDDRFHPSSCRGGTFEVRTSNRRRISWICSKNTTRSIILDLAMPGIDGVELLRWLAEEHSRRELRSSAGSEGGSWMLPGAWARRAG